MEQAFDNVRYELQGTAAVITLNRPPVNALNVPMIRAVIDALSRAKADDNARSVVLCSGTTGRFCAGLDIDILAGDTSKARNFVQSLYVDLFDAQYHLGKPSIAVVTGAARGGGMTLAVSCDMIIAGQSATFGYPEIDVGVIPAIHYVHLPRIVGRQRAFELLFGGDVFDAKRAYELGLLNSVENDTDAQLVAMKWAEKFAGKSQAAIMLGRRAFMRQLDVEYRRGISHAVDDFCAVAATDAAQEKLREFIEQRKR